MYPLVEDLAAEGVSVAPSYRVLGFTPQAFYKWRARPYSNSAWADAHLVNAMVDIHADDPEFGYRFIADELRHAGHTIGENRVHRLCRDNEIWSVFATKHGHGRTVGPPVHDDLIQRHFAAERLDQVWLTGITEHWADEGKLYCCAIKDVCSQRIVGYSIDGRMTAKLAVDALDNAAMESFFSLLQKNVLDRRRWRTRDQLRSRIVNWIERTYHRRRRQRRLGRLTPVEFETVFHTQAPAA